MIAQQSPQQAQATAGTIAAIPALSPTPPNSPNPATSMAATPAAGKDYGPPSASTANMPSAISPAIRPLAAVPPPAGPLPNAEQLKTVFAVVGVLAVLYHAVRMLGSAVG